MKIKPGVTPWQHQNGMADFIVGHAETLMLAGCGVGKTLASLMAMDRLGTRRNLILTVKPALRSVWEEEVANFAEEDNVLILDKGTSAQKRAQIERLGRSQATVVVNYETARKLDLGDFTWDLAVADESHRLKAYDSAQSNTLAGQLAHVPVKIAMTGTAWEDRPTDVFGQVRWLGPAKVPRAKYLGSRRLGSWADFFERYVQYREIDHIKIPVKYIHLDELSREIAEVFHYVSADAVLDLPEKQHITRYARMSDAHRKAYNELKEEMTLQLGSDEITVDNQMVLAMRLHQIAGGFYKPDYGDLTELPDGKCKVDTLQGIAEEIGIEPFVVFTRFTEDVNRIASAFKGMGIRHKVLVGGKDQHMAWRKGDGQALICNIQAGNAGINLTRARYAIYYSTGYSATDYIQSLARIYRPGQQRRVTIFHIATKGTVDIEIRDMLQKKAQNAGHLLGTMSEIIASR